MDDEVLASGHPPPKFNRMSAQFGRGVQRVITIRRTSRDGPEAEDLERGCLRASLPDEAVPLLAGTAASGEEHPLGPHADSVDASDSRMRLAVNSSLAVNMILLIAKAWAYYYSHSKAVLASTADSFVDIASQVVIAVAEMKMRSADPRFPIGQTRLETVGVVACAVIMTLSTIEVIQTSAADLLAGWMQGRLPELDLTLIMYIILGSAAVLKVALFLYCRALQHRSDSIMALAEDHRNDIISNAAAIACGAVASYDRRLWYIDPLGGILASIYIIYSWALICKAQVDKIVGISAPEDFIDRLESMAAVHHERLSVDVIRAYYFGARFLVEVEVVMPADMSVRDSHDIALILQHKVEAYDEVERAFVHVDYQTRNEPEHKVDYNLRHKRNVMEPHDSLSQHGSATGGDGLDFRLSS